MLTSVQVEHEVGERPLQTRPQVPVHGKASARKFGGSFQVEHAQSLPDFPVRLGSKVERRRRAPAADFHVVVRALADRNVWVWNVRDANENLPQSSFVFIGSLAQFFDLLAQV